MKLCILQTDSVLPEYQAEHGDYPGMFADLLADADAEIVTVDARQAPPEAGFAQGYVITGSRNSVYEELPWLPALVEFVRGEMAAGRPVVGICFGHQLIAHYFGGEVRKAEAGWAVGVHETRVVRTLPWMDPKLGSFRILSTHQDQVVRLPDGAELIAETPFCPVSGFVIGDVALCFQGHPEFDKPYAEALMHRRRELIGERTFAGGIESLAMPLDRKDVARWMLRFLGMEAGA